MNEVKRRCWECVLHDVVPAHLEIWMAEGIEKFGIDIDGDHMASGADSLTEPERNRPAPGSDVEALPAFSNPARLQKLNSPRIVDRFEQRKPLKRLGPGIILAVFGLGNRHLIYPI